MALANLAIVSERLLGGKAHPVLSGLIEMLPAPGAAWPAAERDAWIEMARHAFVLAYGAAGENPMSKLKAPRPAPARSRRARPKPKAAARSARRPKLEPGFYIDRQNFVRRRGGERVLPQEVAGYIVDQRGHNGALETMTWADDSVGPPAGVSLDITVADPGDE